jgi:TP901 family phage tail tape measure protein
VPGFNIVAQVQLQGPTNIAAVAQQISSGLSNISANVNVNVNNASLGALQGLGNTIGQLNTSLGALVNASNTASGAVSNLGGSMSRTSAGASVVQQSARTATTSLKGVTTAFQEAEAAGEQFGKSAGLALRRFAGFTLAAGTVFAVVDSFKHGIEQAILFEREMNKLEQVNAGTVTQIKEVERAISSLSTTFGTSSQSLSQAAVLLGSAGLKADDVTKSLEALAKSAASPQFGNLIDTTNGVIAIMSQFKVPASEIEKSLGAINSVSNAFSTESGDLIEAIKRSGGAFRATGGDLNEFLALFTSVRATTRESAESIATGLRTIFTRFQTPQTVNALKEMGINLRFSRTEAEQLGKVNLTDQFVGPYEAVRRLSTALKDLPTTDPRFSAIIDQLGGYRQISRVIPLIQEFGTAQRAYATAQSGALSITAASEKAQESYAVQIAKTKETFLELTRTIVGSEGFRVFLDGLLKIANAAVILLNALGPLIPLLTTLAAIRIGAAIPGFIAGFVGGFRGEQPKRLAIGGVVPGVGNTDTVPAMLTPGEFVVRKESAQRIGYSNLSKLNSGGQVKVKDGVQYLAEGGIAVDIDGSYGGLFLRGKGSTKDYSAYSAGSISSKKLEKILDNDSLRKRIRGELHLIRPQGQELGLNLTVGNEGYKINDILANGATVADVPVKFAGSPGVHLIDPNAARNFNTIIEQGVRTAVITSTRTVLDSAGIKSDNSTVAAFKAMKENGLDSVIGHAFEATLVGIAGSVGERTTPGEYFDFKNVDSKTIQGLSQLFSNVNESYLDVKSTASSGNIRSLVGKAINTLSEGSSDFSLSYNRARSENVPALIREIETNTNNTRKRLQSKAPPVKLARGGVVPGVGDTDSVPAQLMPGEFVIRKSSAQKIGYEALSSLNNFGGQIRKFEQGGSVFDKDVSDQNIKKVTDFFNKLGLSGIDLNKLISRLYFVDKVPSKYGNDPYGKFDLNSRAVLIKAPSYTAKGELVKEGADYETLGHEIFGHALSLKVANLNKSARLPTSDPSTLLGEVAAQSKDHLYPLVKNKEYRQKEAEKYQKAGFPDLVLDEAFANAMQTYVRLLAVKKGEVPLDNQLKSILTDPKAYSVLYRVHNEIIPLLKQVTSEESPALNVNLSKLKDTHDQVKGQFLGIGKKFFASGGPVLMAGGGEAKGKFKQIALELAGALGIFTGGINVDDLAEYLERSKSQVVAGSIEQEKRRRATPPKSPGYALGGRVRMAFGGGPTFSYGKKKESLTYSELEALGLGKEDLEEFKKIGEGQLTEVSKIDENKKERKLKTLQLPLFPTERFAMIYRGDASTAGLDRVHFSSRKGLSKLSGPAERFLSDYGKLPPDGPVEGIRARFDKHVFSEKAASDFEVRIKLKVRSYLNNLFKEEFPSSQLSLNVKDKTMQDITGGLFETYVSGLSQIPTAGKNETFDIKDARIQVSEINKVLYPKLQTGLADIKSSGGDNNITSMIGKILNYEVAQGGNKAIDTARIGLAPGEVLAPPLSFKQQRLKDLTESFASVGLPLPQRYKDLYGKAKGGEVDSVPALLTPGEFVINRESASRIGLSELNRMNVTGKTGGGLIQRFADGGLVQKILDLISGNNPASIAKEDIAVKAEEARQAANLQRGLYHTDTEFQPLAGNKIPEVQAALAAVVNTRAAKLGARAQTEEGLGGTTVPGSRLEQIETKLHREMIAGGVDPTIAAQEAKSRAEEYRNAELRNKAEQELIKETVAMAVVRRDEHNKILSTSYQLVSKREVAEAELARQAEELKSKGKDRFGGFASADAQREIASRGGAARLSTTSINEINTGAQTRLAQELVQSEVARIRGLKLGIKSDEIERLARENVTNALLLERKVITDGVTGKRKLEDSENLATAKNLELARETDHLTNQQKQTELAQKGVGGAVSGLQGEIRPGIGDRLKSFLTNPAALAGIAYSATAYAPGLINQAQGGSFEERLPGQVGPRGEVRGDLRERGVAAVGAAGTGLAAGFGAAALGSTLATAGVIGAAAVPPIAIIAGVVAGLLTFTQSLHEQEKQIRSAQLGKALDSLALKINDFNSGKLFGGEAGFSVVGREFQNTERLRRAEDTTSRGYAFGLFTDNTPQKVTATEEKSLREKVLPQLPGLLQAQEKVLGDIFTRQNAENIRGGVSLNPNELKGQVESVLADFLKAGDGFGKQILETTARLKNVPYAEVERETKQQIIAIQNSARVVTNELQARALLSSQLNSLVTFTNSLNGAIIALKEFDDKLSLTGQIVSGNVTGGQVNVRGDVTQAVQSADTDTLNKVLTESLGVLGSRLDTLRTPITELNRANRELPGILAQAGSTPRGPLEPGTFGDRVTTLLQNASFGREITTAITSALDTQFKDPAALQQALTRDIGGLSKQLVKEYQPLLDAVANISKSVQDETNKFIGSLSQSSRFLEEINANLQQGATLSLQYSRTTAENQAIRAGRRGDAGSFVSLQQLESPYNQLQQRLAPNVANPFDAGAITRQLDKVNEGLRRQDEIRRTSIGTTAGDKAAQQFEKLAFESNNLQKALKNLADVSSRAAGIQEKLGQLQQDRESRLSFGERFITSDAAGQGQIQRGLALINLTAQTKSAEGLTDPDRRLLFETLHSLGNARLPAAGNITAKDFSEQLVESFGGGIFKPQIGDQQKELDLRQTLIQYFDAARQSNEALVNKESEGYDKFIQDLTRAHTIFLTKLEQIELQTVQATLQRQKEQADVEKGLATSQKTARDEIRDKTGIGGLSTDDQKNFVGALLKNQDEIRKLNDLQSVKGGNFRPDTVVNDIRKSLDTRNIDADIRGTKQLVTGRTFYQVDQGDLTNRITSLVEKNISSLGLSQKYIPQITAAAQKQVGDISGFSKSEVQESYTEALNNLPRIIVDLKEVEEARSQQIRDYNTLESKLIENLSSGKPELKESAQAALKNFPQIAPALSQFQSGEQFGKITDRLDKRDLRQN